MKKGFASIVFCALFVLIFSSFAFAGATIMQTASCSPGNIILYLSNDTNAFGSTSSGTHVLCYTPTPNAPSIPSSPKVDLGLNTIGMLSSASGSLIEAPGIAPSYTIPITYKHLSCRLASASETAVAGESVFFWISGQTSKINNAQSVIYNQKVLCREPVCDSTTFTTIGGFSQSTFSPMLMDFEAPHVITKTTGVAAAESSEKAVTGAKSLKLEFTKSAGATTRIGATIPVRTADLNKYQFLEFAYYPVNELVTALEVTTTSGKKLIALSSEFAPLGLKLNDWNIVRIPVSALPTGTITSLSFQFDPTLYNSEVAKTYIAYVDSIALRAPATNADYALQFCGLDGATYRWTTDLDSANYLNSCKNSLLLTKTATRCCGDDISDVYTDAASGACWYGKKLADGTFFGSYTYKLNGVSSRIFCSGTSTASTCIVPFPPLTDANTLFGDAPGTTTTTTTELVDVGGSNAVSLRAQVSDTKAAIMGFAVEGTGDATATISFFTGGTLPLARNPRATVYDMSTPTPTRVPGTTTFTVTGGKTYSVVILADDAGMAIMQVSTPVTHPMSQFSGRGFVSLDDELVLGLEPIDGKNIELITAASTDLLSATPTIGLAANPTMNFYSTTGTATMLGANDDWTQLTPAQKTKLWKYAPKTADTLAAALPYSLSSNTQYTINVKDDPAELLTGINFVNGADASVAASKAVSLKAFTNNTFPAQMGLTVSGAASIDLTLQFNPLAPDPKATRPSSSPPCRCCCRH
ncbi:MAG TPA: hypothetical protein VK158_02900, partial [Acidobacteriota bacterium]|nr:hypothetical protein [Acidobacteriota bacterium]